MLPHPLLLLHLAMHLNNQPASINMLQVCKVISRVQRTYLKCIENNPNNKHEYAVERMANGLHMQQRLHRWQ